MRDEKDRSEKWLLGRFGNRILTGIAGVTEHIVAWKALQPEVVQPKQLPDGLLEVRFAGQKQSDRFLIEIATYPEKRVSEQMMRDAALVYLDQHRLPEVVTLVLAKRGQERVTGATTHQSRRGWTEWKLKWKVVNLWEVPAEQLLALDDVGLIPWVPLTDFKGAEQSLLRECRRRIDVQARPEDQGNLLAVTQVLGRLRFEYEMLAAIFKESDVMIESPFLKEFVDAHAQEVLRVHGQRMMQAVQEEMRQEVYQQLIDELRNDVLEVLSARFEKVPKEVKTALQAVVTQEKLRALTKMAALCPSLKEFRKHLKS